MKREKERLYQLEKYKYNAQQHVVVCLPSLAILDPILVCFSSDQPVSWWRRDNSWHLEDALRAGFNHGELSKAGFIEQNDDDDDDDDHNSSSTLDRPRPRASLSNGEPRVGSLSNHTSTDTSDQPSDAGSEPDIQFGKLRPMHLHLGHGSGGGGGGENNDDDEDDDDDQGQCVCY